MIAESPESGSFESSRLELLTKSPDELADIFAERFDDTYPSDGLYAGTFRDRVWQFVLNRVRAICTEAADRGKEVWDALHDDHTAHNTERFALVCGFFASRIFPDGHWHMHEITSLVLLIISIRPRTGGST